MKLYPRSRLRNMLSGGMNPYNRDLYATNGFQLPVTNTNASVKWVEDLDGTLVQSPANKPAMPGMRLTDGVWYPTASDGSLISPISRMLRTAQGSVAEYDETYPGLLVEPAGTNKCTCRKVNPTDTTGLSCYNNEIKFTLENKMTEIAAAGLQGSCTGGIVYKAVNTSISLTSGIVISGQPGNLNSHSVSAYVMGDAFGIGLKLTARTNNGNVAFGASASFVKATSSNVTPSDATFGMQILLAPGAAIYFIMPELVESPFLTSPIMPKPTEDTLASVTRAADNVTFATPSWLLAHPNDFAVILRCIPAAVQDAKHLLSSYTDANNETSLILSTAAVTLRKRAAGTSTDTAVTYTHAAATLFEVIAYSTTVLGTGIALRSHNGTAWSDWSAWTTNDAAGAKANAVLASVVGVGAQTDSAGHCAATFPMTRIMRIPTNLSAAALQAWLVAKAGA